MTDKQYSTECLLVEILKELKELNNRVECALIALQAAAKR